MKFQIFRDRSGQHRVRLVASNGRILMSYEAYTRKQKALAMIDSVKKGFGSLTGDIKIEEVEK